MYWCNDKKRKPYKQMIVMLNLVLIDVICIVSFCSIQFYTFNVRLYICFVSLNLYITSCVLNLSLQFLYIRCFGECEPFFLFEKGFLQKHEHCRTASSLVVQCAHLVFVEGVISRWITLCFLNASHLIYKGNVGTCSGVFVFLSLKHFMFSFSFSSYLV